MKLILEVSLLQLMRWSCLPALGFLWRRGPPQVSDLLNQIVLLVTELLVL